MSELWSRVRQFLGLDYDDDKTYLRVILFIISATALIATGVLVITSAFVGFSNVTTATTVACAVSFVMLVLTWRGHLLWPRFVFPLLAFSTATYLVFVGDGIRDEAMTAYPLTIILSGLLLGRVGVISYTVLSILAVSGIVYGEVNGLIITNFSDHTSPFNLIVFCALFAFIGVMLYVIINSLTNNLHRAQQNEKKLAKSNRELQAIQASLEEEVAQRTQSADAARQASEEANWALEAQMWQLAGQTKLSQVMRGEQDVVSLANNVIQQLCRYLDAQVGTLFLKEGNLLKPVGRYAYSAELTSFRVGEGLIGQAAIEKQTIVLEEIPPGAMQIASGLGKTTPRHILISPFLYEDNLVGVVEIGTLAPCAPEHVAFIDQVTEGIAIAFNTAKTRARIQELLAETQQQTEELQLREEELRALNEELESQADALRGRQSEVD